MLQKEWMELLDQSPAHGLAWVNCLGHAGVPGNETADKLASNSADSHTDSGQRYYHDCCR